MRNSSKRAQKSLVNRLTRYETSLRKSMRKNGVEISEEKIDIKNTIRYFKVSVIAKIYFSF